MGKGNEIKMFNFYIYSTKSLEITAIQGIYPEVQWV